MRSPAAVRYIYATCAYIAFVVAAVWAVLFLADVGPLATVDSTRSGKAWSAVLVDVGLWLVFGLQHSVMARPGVKVWLRRVVPAALERSTYVLVTGLVLVLLFTQWRALPATIWQLDAQPWAACAWTLYGIGWAVAVAATFMTDHGEFLGLRQAGLLAADAPPSPSVTHRWLYATVRHPMMVGLLVAFWATPVMTAGHLLFAICASGYIAVGVHFEERDLRRRHGLAYDEYARQVPRFVPVLVSAERRSALIGLGSSASADR